MLIPSLQTVTSAGEAALQGTSYMMTSGPVRHSDASSSPSFAPDDLPSSLRRPLAPPPPRTGEGVGGQGLSPTRWRFSGAVYDAQFVQSSFSIPNTGDAMIEQGHALPRLSPVLEYLTTSEDVAPSWDEWQITRIPRGRNSLVYRVTGEAGDFAVKLSAHDGRDRAGREYRVLRALANAGLTFAPYPVLLDEHSYRVPVLVQTWLAGETPAAPLTNDDDWLALLRHLLAIQAVTPDVVTDPLQRSSVTAFDVSESRQTLDEQLDYIAPDHRPPALHDLVRRLDETAWPSWPRQPIVLCRSDVNLDNFLRRPGAWASVDWEYAGWGDSAFEIAKLLAHPSFQPLPAERRRRVTNRYCELRGDASAAVQVGVYYRFVLVGWAIRFARYLYEIPRGRHERLAPRPPDWQDQMQRQYEQYVELASEEVDAEV